MKKLKRFNNLKWYQKVGLSSIFLILILLVSGIILARYTTQHNKDIKACQFVESKSATIQDYKNGIASLKPELCVKVHIYAKQLDKSVSFNDVQAGI